MKTKFFAVMIVCLMLCACSLPASAVEFPSSISGAYNGQDRSCTVVLSEIGANKLGSVTCNVWHTRDLIDSESTGHANGVCPTDFYIPLRSVYVPILLLDTPYLRLVDYTATTLTVRVGTQAEIAMNGGELQIWTKVANVASPSPYSCLLPVPPVKRPQLCGQFGWFCG